MFLDPLAGDGTICLPPDSSGTSGKNRIGEFFTGYFVEQIEIPITCSTSEIVFIFDRLIYNQNKQLIGKALLQIKAGVVD